MAKSAWEHLKIRAKRAGGLSPWQDIMVAVFATMIGYLVLDRKSAKENAVIALVIGLGAAITWQTLRFTWRFVLSVPREMEAERDAAMTTASAKTTMSRDWPGDWRLMEDGFRRYSESSVRADWQSFAPGIPETWSVCGDQPGTTGDVKAYCAQAGKLLIVSPLDCELPAEIGKQQDHQIRWLYFLKHKYGLNDVKNFIVEHGDAKHHVTLGSIHKLASVSARACVECAGMAFRT